MTNLETRLNVTSQELANIAEDAKGVLFNSIDNDSSMTNTDIFETVLSAEQFTAFKSNAMTKALCLDLLK